MRASNFLRMLRRIWSVLRRDAGPAAGFLRADLEAGVALGEC
jgi:hypothetical protein